MFTLNLRLSSRLGFWKESGARPTRAACAARALAATFGRRPVGATKGNAEVFWRDAGPWAGMENHESRYSWTFSLRPEHLFNHVESGDAGRNLSFSHFSVFPWNRRPPFPKPPPNRRIDLRQPSAF